MTQQELDHLSREERYAMILGQAAQIAASQKEQGFLKVNASPKISIAERAEIAENLCCLSVSGGLCGEKPISPRL